MIIMWAIADMFNFKKDPKQHLLCDFFMRCWFLQPCDILSFFSIKPAAYCYCFREIIEFIAYGHSRTIAFYIDNNGGQIRRLFSLELFFFCLKKKKRRSYLR